MRKWSKKLASTLRRIVAKLPHTKSFCSNDSIPELNFNMLVEDIEK